MGYHIKGLTEVKIHDIALYLSIDVGLLCLKLFPQGCLACKQKCSCPTWSGRYYFFLGSSDHEKEFHSHKVKSLKPYRISELQKD